MTAPAPTACAASSAFAAGMTRYVPSPWPHMHSSTPLGELASDTNSLGPCLSLTFYPVGEAAKRAGRDLGFLGCCQDREGPGPGICKPRAMVVCFLLDKLRAYVASPSLSSLCLGWGQQWIFL